MAEWNKNKVEPSAINNGQEFKLKDNLAIDELNAIVNNSFYASDKAKRAEELAESVVKGNGTNVTIDGKIQGEWSADFAESERQKSKNLCQFLSVNTFNVGVSATLDSEQQRLKLNGTCTIDADYYGGHRNLYPMVKNAKGKTFTISNRIVSGSYSGTILLYLGSQDEVIWSDRFSVQLNSSSTFTITTDHTYDTIMVFVREGTTIHNLEIEVQIEEGDIATDWQYSYGAIVHEKQLNEAVTKRSMLYQHDLAIIINNSSLTTLTEYFDLFNQDDTQVYFTRIGSLDTTNFKDVVGTPSGFGGYVGCFIKKEVNGILSNGCYDCYKLLAIDDYGNKTAISYIYKDLRGDVKFTGWTVIGG